jgi:dCMP deaminase
LKIFSKTKTKITDKVMSIKDEVNKKVTEFVRPSWDEIWMETAHLLAKRSYDPRYQVGTIIVTKDNTQVLAVGYNGNWSGGPNEVESAVPGESGMIHAEVNALLKCDYNNPKKKIAYVTLSPCRMCAKALVNAGISEVVYDKEYRNTSGLDILKKAGLKVRQIF